MIRLTYPSFRLLLYLEWLLLATAVFMVFLPPSKLSWSLLLRILVIAIFGLMGFLLPKVGLRKQLLYTAVEFGLILLPVTQGNSSARSVVLLLCLVLVMRSCLMFKIPGQLIVLGLSLISYGTLLFSQPIRHGRFRISDYDWRLSNILLFTLTLIFALLLINALLAERKSRKQLEIANQQLRQYALRIENQATLQERNRIAREIHDGLGHTLAAQTIQINNALLFWESNNEKALMFIKQSKQLAAEALLEIRRSLSVLRTHPLQGKSLNSAIEKLLIDFQETTGIQPDYKIDLPLSLPIEINTALYRIVQESLTNICKHSQATNVTVELISQDEMIHLLIEDNGKGFNPSQNTTGFGLQGMQERAIALGGQLNIQSELGKGCCIAFYLPLAKMLYDSDFVS
jgi:signal transduction histidine kinase